LSWSGYRAEMEPSGSSFSTEYRTTLRPGDPPQLTPFVLNMEYDIRMHDKGDDDKDKDKDDDDDDDKGNSKHEKGPPLFVLS